MPVGLPTRNPQPPVVGLKLMIATTGTGHLLGRYRLCTLSMNRPTVVSLCVWEQARWTLPGGGKHLTVMLNSSTFFKEDHIVVDQIDEFTAVRRVLTPRSQSCRLDRAARIIIGILYSYQFDNGFAVSE